MNNKRLAQQVRDRDRIFTYNNAQIEYHSRFLPMFVMTMIGLLAAMALVYIGIQVWAFTKTGHIYPAYFYPPCIVVAVYMLLSVVASKVTRPTYEY